jgi:hypothetical protein
MRFEFPIEITVILGGKKVQAMIFEAVPETDNCGFRVRFEDGFEDKFFLAGENGDLGPVGSKKNWMPYGTALRPDLLIVSSLIEGQDAGVFRHNIDGIDTNIWVTSQRQQGGKDYFYVHYNQHCRFQFDKNRETGNWHIVNNYSGDTDVNLDLVKVAGAIIESEKNKVQVTA